MKFYFTEGTEDNAFGVSKSLLILDPLAGII